MQVGGRAMEIQRFFGPAVAYLADQFAVFFGIAFDGTVGAYGGTPPHSSRMCHHRPPLAPL